MSQRLCLGFGVYGGICPNLPNEAGWWCDRCDTARIAHITERFEKMDAQMQERERRLREQER